MNIPPLPEVRKLKYSKLTQENNSVCDFFISTLKLIRDLLHEFCLLLDKNLLLSNINFVIKLKISLIFDYV